MSNKDLKLLCTAVKAQIAKRSLIWAFKEASGPYDTLFKTLKMTQFQNSSSGKQFGLFVWGYDKWISTFWIKATSTKVIPYHYQWDVFLSNASNKCLLK